MRLYYKNKFSLQPIPFRHAKLFVRKYHSYQTAPQGCLFCLQANYKDEICGVAIVGRPISPNNQDGQTCEITRLCLKSDYNCGASFLASRAWRAAKALGYRRLITYVADSHQGISFRAAGFRLTRISTPHKWHNLRENKNGGSIKVQRFEISDSTACPNPAAFVKFEI